MNRHEVYKEHDYIFYYDENAVRNPVKCVAVGSKRAANCEHKVLKGLRCTYQEACEHARIMNRELRINKKKGRPRNDSNSI